MREEVVDLYREFGVSKRDAVLLPTSFRERIGHLFLCRRKQVAGRLYCYDTDASETKPAMLIFPGGGYKNNSHSEWENVAEAYAERGFRTFVLNYSIKYFKFPTQLNEAVMALSYIRRHKAELGVSDKVAVCGFSAGAHLAATLSCLYADESIHPKLRELDARPDACVLSYPVISAEEGVRNEMSFMNLCGKDEALRRFLSLEYRVSQATPPTFLWHTEEDDFVPYENSLRYAAALEEKGVLHKLCLYRKGAHGLNLAKGYEAEEWLSASVDFLRQVEVI
ncbi:MAG: alpha/beta hydrolase [Clostridia bacterium]|nr:alpha/beta hydrolase [Clostridia bacterium]